MKFRVFAGWRAVAIGLCGYVVLCHAPLSVLAQGESAKTGSLAGAMPPGAVGFAEVTGLGGLVERVKVSSYLGLLTGSPQFQEFEKTPQYKKALAGRQIVEAQLGMDLWKATRELLRDRLAVAVYPKPDGNPAGDVLAMLQGVDPQVLSQLRQRLEPILNLAEGQVEISEFVPGTKVISIDGKVHLAWGETSIVAANTRELLTKALHLKTGKEQGSLADDSAFRAMSAQMGSSHLVTGFVNMALLTKARGGRLTPEKLDNPLTSMFLGGMLELAAGSPFVGLTLDVEENRLLLTGAVAGDSRKLDEAHRVFFSDPAGPGTRDIPQLPGIIGGFTFHLDLANWYRQREKLLEPRLLPGFDQFETGIANLLPGKDIGEDVVPLIGNNMTFVAAPQDYSHLDGKPGLKLPGFGLVLDLARPEEGGDLFQLFFQTLSSILNFQAGEQNRQPWVLNSETYKDVQITFGRYLKKPTGDQLPLVFNFMPASARVGEKFIVCSSLGMCRQLIDSLKSPAGAASRPNRNLNLEIHADAVADILQSNKDIFQARSIQQGTEAARAEKEFSAILQLVRFFDSLRLSTTVKPEAFQVQFEGSWK
jgi:hypothetical protein